MCLRVCGVHKREYTSVYECVCEFVYVCAKMCLCLSVQLSVSSDNVCGCNLHTHTHRGRERGRVYASKCMTVCVYKQE